MGKDLNNAMDSTEGNNQYDEAAKRILGNKEVLSHILTNTVDEYKEMKTGRCHSFDRRRSIYQQLFLWNQD